MPHCRRTLRELAGSLCAGLATTGDRVHQSRLPPRTAAGLPCLLIYADNERIGDTSAGPHDRALEVVIDGYAMAAANLDDTLDQIALEVETAMAADPRFRLRSLAVDFDEALEKPVGVIRLTYEILYFTQAGDPGSFA